MASGRRVDWLTEAKDRWNREEEGDANRLWVAEVVEVETRSARVLGMTVDRSQGCWMGAQVRTVWEAETTAPHLMAAVLALGGSSIGHESRSVSRNCPRPFFGAQDVEEKLRRFSFG